MMTHAPISVADHEVLQSELAICCRQLQSKEQALRILKEELDLSHERMEHSRQEIAQLRSQLARSSSAPQDSMVEERERCIAQLEEAQEKISDLERQLQMEEDEKEEVLGERDYFSSRCSALMKCLEEKESAQPPSQSALQTLAEENRQLKLQLVEVQAERDQAHARIDRYKRAVDRRKTQETQQLQSASLGKHNNLRQTLLRVSELEVLANSLSESVKEKSIALTHQKRANKMLGARIAELEHRLKVLEISGLWSSTSLVPDLTWNEDGRTDTGSKKDGLALLSPERPSASVPFPPPPSSPPYYHSPPAQSSSLAHSSPSTSLHPLLSHSSPTHSTLTPTIMHPSPTHPSLTHSSLSHSTSSAAPPDTVETVKKEEEGDGGAGGGREKARGPVKDSPTVLV